MELKATRYEVDPPAWPRCGSTARTAATRGPAACTPSTGGSSPSWRPILRSGSVVVTGSDGAFCVGGDSEALAGHAERGSYDAGLPAEVATPRARRPARARPRLRVAVGSALPGDRRGERGLRRGRTVAGLLLRPPLRRRPAPSSRRRRPGSGSRPSTASPGCCPASSASRGPPTCSCRDGWSLVAETARGGCWNDVLRGPRRRWRRPRSYAHRLASGVGPRRCATTKRQLYDDLLRDDVGAALDRRPPCSARR